MRPGFDSGPGVIDGLKLLLILALLPGIFPGSPVFPLPAKADVASSLFVRMKASVLL